MHVYMYIINIPKSGIGDEFNKICLFKIPCVQRNKQVSIVTVFSNNVGTTHDHYNVATDVNLRR